MIRKIKLKSYNILKLLLLLTSFALFYSLIVYLTYKSIADSPTFNGSRLTNIGLILESLILFSFGLFVSSLTKRFFLSIVLTTSLYIFFILANIEKINFLYTPIFYADLLYFKQLILAWDVFATYIPSLLIAMSILILTGYIFHKHENKNVLLNKYKYYILGFTCFFYTLVIFNKAQIKDYLIFEKNVGFRRAHLVSSSQRYGLLYIFIKNMIYSQKTIKPLNYSSASIKTILNFTNGLQKKDFKISDSFEDVSLIVYLIESFADPNISGIKTTRDPIPFFHDLQKNNESGFVYSPVVGGNSANAEFELLTGFSMQFFPRSSIPYIDIPNHKIPSLANELKPQGYYCSAIHVADLGFFNYKQMYKMQGFDEILTLWNEIDIKKDPANRFPSDESLVNKIIEVSNINEKFFIFAFPNSTHGKWNYQAYETSDLNLVMDKSSIFKSGEQKLKTYLNALNTADLAIKKLVTYFKSIDRKVAILILGDHQPGLPEFREEYMINVLNNKLDNKTRGQIKRMLGNLDKKDPLLTFEAMHSVPYVLWTNYENNKQSVKYQKGMNSLILKVFDTLNVQPQSKFYQFLNHYSQSTSFDSLLKYLYYNETDITNKEKTFNSYYEELQYDLLLGEDYLNN